MTRSTILAVLIASPLSWACSGTPEIHRAAVPDAGPVGGDAAAGSDAAVADAAPVVVDAAATQVDATLADSAPVVADDAAAQVDATLADVAPVGGNDGGPLVAYGWQLTWTGASAPGLAGAWARGEMGPYQRATFEESLAALPTYDGPFVDGTALTLVKIVTEVYTNVQDNRPELAVKHLLLDRCWFVGSGSPIAAQYSPGLIVPGAGAVIKDSDLEGTAYQANGKNPEAILTYSDVSDVLIDRVRIWNFGVSAKMDGGGLIRETYAQQTTGFDGDHCDGFTRRDGTSRIDIVRSRFMTAVPNLSSGPFFIQNNGQGALNVYASDSLFEGYNWILQWGVGTSIGMRNVRTDPWAPQGYGDTTGGSPETVLEWTDVYRYNPDAPPECRGNPVSL